MRMGCRRRRSAAVAAAALVVSMGAGGLALDLGANVRIVASQWDELKTSPDGSLLMPPALSAVYPYFQGPHYAAMRGITNTCIYGVDSVRVRLEGARADALTPDGNLSIVISLNGLAVAEETAVRGMGGVDVVDYFHPPLVDPKMDLLLEVVAFDGTLQTTRDFPSGIHLGESIEIELRCAPPIAEKGDPVEDSRLTLPNDGEKMLGKLPWGYKNCNCNGEIQTLARVHRISPNPEIYKTKQFESCTYLRQVQGSPPNEPFQTISHELRDVFYVTGDSFMQRSLQEWQSPLLYDELCAGYDLEGTVRMQCECQEVPTSQKFPGTFLDFDVKCPSLPKKTSSSNNSDNNQKKKKKKKKYKKSG